jgi:hypothetical protein
MSVMRRILGRCGSPKEDPHHRGGSMITAKHRFTPSVCCKTNDGRNKLQLTTHKP